MNTENEDTNRHGVAMQENKNSNCLQGTWIANGKFTRDADSENRNLPWRMLTNRDLQHAIASENLMQYGWMS